MNLKETLAALVIMLTLLVAAFFVGRCTAETPQDGDVVVRVDTLYRRDTITRETPVFTRVYVRDSIYVRDTLRDTVVVALPREVKVYEDSSYRAEVSGYMPSLDRIDIYTTERVVTKHKTQIVETKRNAHWGIGVQVGYGGCVTGGTFKPAPYVGVGISYNLLTF